mgnify:FL=1
MDINASDIYSFYNSRLGTIVKRNIRHQLNTHLNSVNDSVICGYGYTCLLYTSDAADDW